MRLVCFIARVRDCVCVSSSEEGTRGVLKDDADDVGRESPSALLGGRSWGHQGEVCGEKCANTDKRLAPCVKADQESRNSDLVPVCGGEIAGNGSDRIGMGMVTCIIKQQFFLTQNVQQVSIKLIRLRHPSSPAL
jgi:hypothetical protein